jgi:hypothetical protein
MYQSHTGLDPHLVALFPFFLFFGSIAAIISIIPYWMIYKKAGFSPWLSLFSIIPMANLIVLYIVAFSQWKVVPVAQLQTGYPAPYPPAYPAPYPPQVPPAVSPNPPNDPYPRG